jgi:predicted HTH domain antitoxin
MLSFGKARGLAKMSNQAFGRLLGERGAKRHYGPDARPDIQGGLVRN